MLENHLIKESSAMNANLDRKNIGKRLQQKIRADLLYEYDLSISSLRERADFIPEFEYFLNVLSLAIHPGKFREQVDKPIVGLYCIQAPLELVVALGFHPVRLPSGSLAVQRLSSSRIPAVACPIIRSRLSHFYADESLEKTCELVVIPTTCDWTTKLPGMIGDKAKSIHIMELPHLKESERGRERWRQEVYELKRVLEHHAGHKLDRRQLQASMGKYINAWRAFGQLIELKRKRVIAGTWSIILANAFMLDDVESWTKQIEKLFRNCIKPMNENEPAVFLAGSPLYFPHLKISELIEGAGMSIVVDELCSSERSMVGAPVYDDPSEHGMLCALSERYHLACTCPTYADNDRRAINIIDTMRSHNIKGLIYHVLKGCHPYDIESFQVEEMVRANGLRFMKIESDYSNEDSQNIMTRLEAFRETLQ